MSNNDNSSSINGIKSIINKAPSSLNDNNQQNNQEVHNQVQTGGSLQRNQDYETDQQEDK